MQRKLKNQIINAIVSDDAELVRQLVVDNGIDVNETFTAQRVTFLMIAAKANAVKAVKTLLELGADACHVDYIGRAASEYVPLGNAWLSVMLMNEEAKCDVG